MDDDREDYDVAESIRSFRRAGSKVIEGGMHLYYGLKERVAAQPTVVQATLSAVLWFGGNWVYNRVAPPVTESIAHALTSIPG